MRGYSGALTAAQQVTALREEFLTVAAHELRTPLTALQLDLQRIRRLERDRSGPALADQLATALRQTHRLGSLIESLLDASALAGDAPVELHPEALDLGKLAREIVGRLRAELDQAGCAVTVEGGPARGVWDRARVERIASTLLRNACKYGEGRPVRVVVEEAGDERLLSVAWRARPSSAPADRSLRVAIRTKNVSRERGRDGSAEGTASGSLLHASHRTATPALPVLPRSPETL